MTHPRYRWFLAPAVAAGTLAAVVAACAAAGGSPPAATPRGAIPAKGVQLEPVGGTARTAAAKLASIDDPKLTGTATFTQEAGAVRVVVDLAGVTKPGPHGLHLHEVGKCESDPGGKNYTTAGGHFNPTGAAHACPDSTAHHAGDFGNIEIQADGSGHYERLTAMLSLSGPSSPVGRALILHAGADDCTTQPTGNSGGRLACGVVVATSGVAH